MIQQTPLASVASTDAPDVIIASRDGRFNTYFPDVTTVRSGGFVAVYYSSTQHMHTPDSTIRLVRGSADGQRWSAPKVIIDHPGMDDRDPSVCELTGGRLLVTWFRRNPVDLESDDAGCMSSYSDDDGETWSEPALVSTTLFLAACSAPPLEIDGRLLLPGYGFLSPADRTYAVRLSVSHDQGKSWDRDSEITVPLPDDVGVGLVEPTLVDLGADRLLMVIRSRDEPQNLAYASWSDDRGERWSVPRRLDFAGHAPHVLRLGGDHDHPTCLVTWGEYSAANTSTRPVQGRIVDGLDPELSGDTFAIYSNPATVDMSYPSAARVDQETVLVIHYDSHRGHVGGSFVRLHAPSPGPEET